MRYLKILIDQVHNYSTIFENKKQVYSLEQLKEKYCPDEESDSKDGNDDDESDESDEIDNDNERFEYNKEEIADKNQKVSQDEANLNQELRKLTNKNEPENEKNDRCNEKCGETDTIEDNRGEASVSENTTLIQNLPLHAKSCRSVQFSHDGSHIFTAGADSMICCLEVNLDEGLSVMKVLWRIHNASKGTAINRLHLLPLKTAYERNFFATGDENGTVCIWDVDLCASNNHDGLSNNKRKKDTSEVQGCVAKLCCHRDYVADLISAENGKLLLSTSGDCTLCAINVLKSIAVYAKAISSGSPIPKSSDLTINESDDFEKVKEKYKLQRKWGVVGCSDDVEDELLCAQSVKGGSKLVIGTQQGILSLWSYGKWDDMEDRITGHPTSVDTILKVDETTILTGSMDGYIRVVQLYPHKFLGVMGSQNGFPVEALAFSFDRRLIASLGHENLIYMWDASILADDENDDIELDDNKKRSNDCNSEDKNLQVEGSNAHLHTSATKINSDDDWNDASNSDSNSASGSDSDDSKRSQEKRFKSDNDKFFSGLE